MTRHPITGQLIENESDWKNAQGEWLPTKFNEQTKQHEPIAPLAAPTVRKGEGGKGDGKEK